jgi:hypothetical protein
LTESFIGVTIATSFPTRSESCTGTSTATVISWTNSTVTTVTPTTTTPFSNGGVAKGKREGQVEALLAFLVGLAGLIALI